MYIFANKGLGMSGPKLAAQVAHAAVEAWKVSRSALIEEWDLGGHYAKIVLEARDTEHLRNVLQYVTDRGFKTIPIIDEGRTEIAPHSFTALGVEIVDKDDPHTAATFSTFKTLKDEQPEPKPAPRESTFEKVCRLVGV